MPAARFVRLYDLCGPVAARLAALAALTVVATACSGASVHDEPKRAGGPDIAPKSEPAEPSKPAEPAKTAESPREDKKPAEPAVDRKPAEPTPEPAKKGPVAMPTALGEVSTFPEGTPDGALRAALACALDDLSDGQAFSCYLSLNVIRNRDTDVAVAQLRAYNWKHFRQYAASYVVRDKPFTVRVTRRDHESGSGDGKSVKLFLFSKSRDFPAPITLEREDGTWRISYNSL